MKHEYLQNITINWHNETETTNFVYFIAIVFGQHFHNVAGNQPDNEALANLTLLFQAVV